MRTASMMAPSELRERQRAERNLNPHAPARAAMWLFGPRYSAQNGGSMDFWDGLTESEKSLCRDMAKDIRKARPE